jgi:hypothetical protein
MLREIHGVTDEPHARRRWFHDDYCDLFVWQADGGDATAGEVTLFQLCYGMDSAERALVWDKARGFFHDGPPATREMVERFDDLATSLPADIGREIRERIHEFAGRKLGVTSRRRKFRRDSWQRTA